MPYRPRFSDGRLTPMPWQLRMFSLNICWPIEANSSWFRRYLDKFVVFISFIFFCLCNGAAAHYIFINFHSFDLVVDALAHYLMLLDLHFRIFHMAFFKSEYRNLIEEFYAKIYIEKSNNEELYRSIKRKLLPTVLHSSLVITTIFGNSITFIVLFSERPLPLQMALPYDINNALYYVPTMIVNYIVALMQASCVIGESYLLGTFILHLNARYQMLQRDCQNLHKTIQKGLKQPNDALSQFHQGLRRIMQRNLELNEFAAKVRERYSWRIFVMLALSSIFLCVLSFLALMFGISVKSASYIIWFSAKTLDLFAFGQLGSILISTTSEIGSMYYESNWEAVIQHSSNGVENAKIMKLIALAVEMNQKPMYITGLSFFNLSLPSFMAILQGTYTYLSCFYAIRYS